MVKLQEHSPAGTDQKQVLITRVFNAPRELVFRAWSSREHLERWHAPSGCRIEYRQFDFRPGGKLHSCIHTPDGKACWCIGTYREIVAPERIVYSMAMSDEQGNELESLAAGKDSDWPRETIITVTFAEHAGRTKLTLHQTVAEEIAERTGAYPSWLNMLEQLAAEVEAS